MILRHYASLWLGSMLSSVHLNMCLGFSHCKNPEFERVWKLGRDYSNVRTRCALGILYGISIRARGFCAWSFIWLWNWEVERKRERFYQLCDLFCVKAYSQQMQNKLLTKGLFRPRLKWIVFGLHETKSHSCTIGGADQEMHHTEKEESWKLSIYACHRRWSYYWEIRRSVPLEKA